MQNDLRYYITCKVWTFSGHIQNILFHFAQLILFITVGFFVTITIWAPSNYSIGCGTIMTQHIVLGFNFYHHKRNILCWEISAMFEFFRLHCECVELHAASSSRLNVVSHPQNLDFHAGGTSFFIIMNHNSGS